MDMKYLKNQFVIVRYKVRDEDHEEEVSLINNLQKMHERRQKDLEE